MQQARKGSNCWRGATGRRDLRPDWTVLVPTLCCAPLLVVFLVVPGVAAEPLRRFLPKVQPGELLPGADEFGAPAGSPGIVPILERGREVGYAFLNSDFVNAAGYSGKPIDDLASRNGSGGGIVTDLFETHGLTKRYRADAVLEDVSLSVGAGRCVALVGHNGAGKTTLIKLL